MMNAIAVLSLLVVILPSVLFLNGNIDLVLLKQIMLYGTILWFIVNIFKMNILRSWND